MTNADILQYPQWTGRRDKRGIPTYVFEVAGLNSKSLAAYESAGTKAGNVSVNSKVPPKMLRLFALYENLTNFALPLCSAIPDRMFPETPVSQSSNIVDISNVGLEQFWNLKAHMQDASTLATAHYPETLDRIFIIGAPSFFPTVWGWIKRWFDPITVSKIFILSKQDMLKTLEEFMDIENIPKKYGGRLDYEFGQLPNLDPAIAKELNFINPHTEHGRKTFPTGPIRWRKNSNGELVATAVGSVHGKRRDTPVASLRGRAEKPPKAEVSKTLGVGGRGDLAMYRTKSNALDTHPPTPPPEHVDIPTPPDDHHHAPQMGAPVAPATDYSRSAAPPMGAPVAPVADYSRDSTKPIAFRPLNESSLDDDSAVRVGTTATRYEQQSATHAHGTLANNTPNLRGSGDGDRHGVYEPTTVGQAPKEHPVPGQWEQPAPSYVEQAEHMAESAYASAAGYAGAAMKAVGLTGTGQQAEEHAEEQKVQRVPDDPRVDAASEKDIEEYLRNQYRSRGPGSK